MRSIRIHWNGFLSKCCKGWPNECCAFLYADEPFSENEELWVFPISNVSKTPAESWEPDKKEMLKVKRNARELSLTKVGNIHSHPLPSREDHQGPPGSKDREELIDDFKRPSERDLKFARKFNDIIRGILVVDSEGVYEQYFHDQYGIQIKLLTEGIDDEN